MAESGLNPASVRGTVDDGGNRLRRAPPKPLGDNVTRKLTLALLGALAGVSLLFTGATPALAAHTGPAGYTTIWDGCPVGYCGAAWPLPVGSTHVCRALPTGANDKPSAVDNYTSWKFTFYKDAGCKGTAYVIYAGTYTGALTSSQGNNSWSSYYVG